MLFYKATFGEMSYIWEKVLPSGLDDLKKCNRNVLPSDQSTLQGQCQPTFGMINSNDALLRFDHGKNVALCIGIDGLTKNKELPVESDAKEMFMALTKKLGFSSEQVEVSVHLTSEPNNSCRKEELRTAFIKNAEKVEDDGTFLFYYSGHGHESQGRFVLVPADFTAEDESSGISGDDLVQWLMDAQCGAKNVLFVFDCCYAGNLGETLTLRSDLNINANLFAMCACAPGETSTGITELRNSTFTYFLLDYLNTSFQYHEEFNITQAMSTISKFCFRFSCLILFHKNGQYILGISNPKHYISLTGNPGYDQSNPERQDGNSLLTSLFDKGTRYQAHPKVKSWLQLPFIKESLQILNEKASRYKRLQKAIFSVLLLSSATLHYAHANKKAKKLLQNRNMFLEIAIIVLEEIDFDVTKDYVITGLGYYKCVVENLLDTEARYLQILWNAIENGSEDEENGSCCCNII